MKLNSLLPSHIHFARICCTAALLMLMSLAIMPSANAEDINCNSTFPGPIQSYDPTGRLYMQSDARVLGFSGVNVCFARIHNENEMAFNACGSGKCVLNDNPYNRLSRERTDVQLRNSIDRNSRYTVARWTEPYVVVGETPSYGRYVSAERFDIGSLTINGNGSGAMLSFSDNFSSYTLGNVRLDEDGVLRLTAGKTYIIDGDVTLSSGRILVVGSGKTNFYISGNYTSHNASKFLGDADIDIYVGGNFTLTSKSTVHGSVYVGGNATFENSSRLVGEIAARIVEIKSASTVVYRRSQNDDQLSCFGDNFSSDALGDNWVAAVSSGSFKPQPVFGRLRMTQSVPRQSTSATFQRLFPTINNLMTIEFDHYAYGGRGGQRDGADGMALVLSDAGVTPQPGAFGGPLGYGFKTGNPGFAGGWLGVGLDEFGNYSSQGGSVNYGSSLRQTVGVRGSGAGYVGYNFLTAVCDTSSWHYWWNGECLSPTIDSDSSRPHRYRMTLDTRQGQQANLKIERNTGRGYETLINNFDVLKQYGQAPLPAELLLSLTGSTGDNYNVHEIDNLQVCAIKSTPIEGRIDHFEIDIDDTPLTCTPLNMTIKACSNADCSEVFNEPVSATLQPNDGHWLTGNPINFSGGSTTISLSKTQVGSVTLDVSGSAPVTKAFRHTLCRQNGGLLSTQACTVNFSDSGFILDVPDKLAARPESVTIKAVKKDDFSQRCVSAFAKTNKNLRFWSNVIERPTIDGYNAPPVLVNNHAIGESASSTNIQSVTFDEKGEARVNVNYADAGKMALNVRYLGDNDGDDAGLVMDGSDNFVSFPAGLCVSAPAPASQCGSRDASCTAFTAAGAPFELNVRAKQWQSDNDSNICDNADTPLFAMTNVSLSHKLLAPSAGQLGELALQNYTQQASITGTSVQQAISEVGVFTVAASVNQPYIGSSAFTIPAFDSAPIGRFYPASFTVDGISVPPACGNFTYLAQPFNVSMTLKALNTSTALTQNYTGAFANGQPIFEAKAGATSADLSNRLPALTGRWLNGQLSYSNHSVVVDRSANAQPEGPYSQLELGIRVDDSDNVPMFNATMRADSGTVDCGGSCNAAHLATMELRLGRAVLANSYGPENQPVLMNGQSQFWNGNQWQLNSDDSCSVVTPAMQTQQDNVALGYSFEPSLTNGRQVIRTGAPAVLSDGHFGLSWLATGTYQGKVTAPVIVPDYLKWYWQFDRAAEVLQDPRASAYFGRYRGNDRIINWRERR